MDGIIEKIPKKTRNKYNTKIKDEIKIRKGICFWDNTATTKNRIGVVLKKIEDKVIFTVLTSSDNIHKAIAVNDENFKDNYYSYALYITHVDNVKKHYAYKIINDKSINSIIKELKQFFLLNL